MSGYGGGEGGKCTSSRCFLLASLSASVSSALGSSPQRIASSFRFSHLKKGLGKKKKKKIVREYAIRNTLLIETNLVEDVRAFFVRGAKLWREGF